MRPDAIPNDPKCGLPACRQNMTQASGRSNGNFHLCVILIVIVLCVGAGPASSQDRVTAPVERSGFAAPTSHADLSAFMRELQRSSTLEVSEIGKSLEGRSLWLVHAGGGRSAGASPKLRVMLFGQQHGDEPAGKEALTLVLARCASGRYDSLLSRLELLVVPQMNPDGAERDRRRTSDKIDLNRSHLLLSAPEVRALHEVFETWRPQVTVDAHEYGPSDEGWEKAGVRKTADVQLGTLTNLNSSPRIREYQHRVVYAAIAADMKRQGYSFQEYLVGSPDDRLRHSTTEINDGRQSFGILNTMSFIQEGRKWSSSKDHLERRARAQAASIEALLAVCCRNAAEIGALVASEQRLLMEQVGKPFILRMDRTSGGGIVEIPVRRTSDGVDTVWRVSPFHDRVRGLDSTTVPHGYVVPQECLPIIALLDAHRVAYSVAGEPKRMTLKVYVFDRIGADTLEEDSLPRPYTHTVDTLATVRKGDVIVSCEQWRSLFVVTMLEPESMWGLTKYPAFDSLLRGPAYPVLRIP